MARILRTVLVSQQRNKIYTRHAVCMRPETPNGARGWAGLAVGAEPYYVPIPQDFLEVRMLSGNDTDPSFDVIAPDSRMAPSDSCALRLLGAVLAGWLLLTAVALGGGCLDASGGLLDVPDGKVTGLAGVGVSEPGLGLAAYQKGCP